MPKRRLDSGEKSLFGIFILYMLTIYRTRTDVAKARKIGIKRVDSLIRLGYVQSVQNENGKRL